MLPVGFEPTISADKRQQTNAFRPRGPWDRHLSISANRILLPLFFIASFQLVPDYHYVICSFQFHYLFNTSVYYIPLLSRLSSDFLSIQPSSLYFLPVFSLHPLKSSKLGRYQMDKSLCFLSKNVGL